MLYFEYGQYYVMGQGFRVNEKKKICLAEVFIFLRLLVIDII